MYFCWVPELSAESIVMMGTGAKWCPVKLKPICDALGPNKTSSFTRVSYTYWSRHQWTQNTGKAKTYILQDDPESFRWCDQRSWWLWGWNVSVRSGAMWLWTGRFLPYFLPDARKMAHVQTTVPVWSSWIDMHQHSGQRGPEWRGESSFRRMLDLAFNGYINH